MGGIAVAAACVGGGRRLMPPELVLTAAADLAASGDDGAHEWMAATLCLDRGGGGARGRQHPQRLAVTVARMHGRQQRYALTALATECAGGSGLGGLWQRRRAGVTGGNGMTQRRWRRSGRAGGSGLGGLWKRWRACVDSGDVMPRRRWRWRAQTIASLAA